MKIIKSCLLEKFPEITFGMSTKVGLDRKEPYCFNMSLNVGDDDSVVEENRKVFFNELGLHSSLITFQKQIHSDIIKFVEVPGIIGESDAMITAKTNIALAVSTADCTPIFIYDAENKVIAAVHSGWRGTQKQILKKTLHNLRHHFKSSPQNLYVYAGPSISQKNYEVGKETAILFDDKYLKFDNGKIFLDVLSANVDMLCSFGVPEEQIEVSPYCTFDERNLLHSYRRDGGKSGRALGIIVMRGNSVFGRF
ncbi:MAG: peptidoglycan editing factor PgeF [Ignavibacteriales bacterium]|nr:peptidoglycan editing factor PgeF [Ignavibacteriales bacterium]